MCVIALQLSSWRLRLGTTIILAAVLEKHEFGLVCDRQHVKETGGTVEQNRLNNTLVQQLEEMGRDIESF